MQIVVCVGFEHSHQNLPTGRYRTIIPESVLRFGAMRAEIKALPVDFPTQPRSCAVVTLKNRMLSQPQHVFVEAARLLTTPLANDKFI